MPRRTARAYLARLAAALAVVLTAALAARPAAAQSGGFVVVVNAANPVAAMPKGAVARFFQRKARKWEHGAVAEPVDQRDETAVRRTFSTQVVGKDVAAIKGYWQQQVFTGKGVPPLVKASDADVVAFVAANPGGIGYVSAGTTLPASVRALQIRD